MHKAAYKCNYVYAYVFTFNINKNPKYLVYKSCYTKQALKCKVSGILKGKPILYWFSRHLNIINVTKQSEYPFNIICTYIHMYINYTKNITMYPCLATYTYVCHYV